MLSNDVVFETGRSPNGLAVVGCVVLMMSVLSMSACSEGVEQAPQRTEQAASPKTVFQQLQSASPDDTDGDGVVDSIDKCLTPIVTDDLSGNVRPRVNPNNGCQYSVLPSICSGDAEPPRLILGANNPLGDYQATVRLHKEQFRGRTVFRIEVTGGDDFDILDGCPSIQGKLVTAFQINDRFYPWICETHDVPEQFQNPPPNGELNRQLRVGYQNPCVFDPAVYGIDEQMVQAAISTQKFGFTAGLVVKDAKGNSLRTSIGGAEFKSSTCDVAIARREYNADAKVKLVDCISKQCERGLKGKTSAPTLTKPSIPADAAVIPNAEFTVKLHGTFDFDQNCGLLSVEGFLRNVHLGSHVLEGGTSRKLCKVTRPNGDSDPNFELSCHIFAPSLFVPGQGSESLSGDVEVRGHVGHDSEIVKVPFSFVL